MRRDKLLPCPPLPSPARRLHRGSLVEEWFQPGSRPDGLARRRVQFEEQAPPTAGQPSSGAFRRSATLRHASHMHRSSVAAGWELPDREPAVIHEYFDAATEGAAPAAGALLERRFDLAGSRLLLTVVAPEAGGEPLVREFGELFCLL